jgi:DNA (cytosine-5)-methyltransferase 1
MGNTNDARLQISQEEKQCPIKAPPVKPSSDISNFWSDAIWHQCRDGKARRIPNGIKPVLQRVADGFPGSLDNSGAISDAANGFPLAQGIRGRVGLLKGYGNAICPQVAQAFIQAVMEILDSYAH